MSLVTLTSSLIACPIPPSPAPTPAADRKARRRARVLLDLNDIALEGEAETDPRERQVRELTATLRPGDAWQEWVTGEIALTMIRITRCARVERQLRAWAAYRAIDFWEDDQQLAVETLVLRLDKAPGRVVARLRQSPAGCGWLLKRWEALGSVDPHNWSVEQQALARRLVGDDPLIDPATRGFAAGQVAELGTRRRQVEEADAILRGLVEADLSDAGVPGLAALRRYARALDRRLQWYLDHFHLAPCVQSNPSTELPAMRVTTARKEISETKPLSAGHADSVVATESLFTPQTQAVGEPDQFERFLAELEALDSAAGRTEVSLREREWPRSRRAEPAREVAHRQKSARRRESLACLAGG